MAKKDENGRLVIPADIVQSCKFLSDSTIDEYNFVYFINNLGEIGVSVVLSVFPFPDDFKFLGNCNYDRTSRTITIPENVDVALGVGEDYYFATPFDGRAYLYIYKHQTDMQKLSAIFSNVEKTFKELDSYINEDIDD